MLIPLGDNMIIDTKSKLTFRAVIAPNSGSGDRTVTGIVVTATLTGVDHTVTYDSDSCGSAWLALKSAALADVTKLANRGYGQTRKVTSSLEDSVDELVDRLF
jgi:hypothetical protein